MGTTLAIDDTLLEEAQMVGRHKAKKDTVTEALKEYIRHRKQLEVPELFGKIDYDADYDYKKHEFRTVMVYYK